MSNTACYKDGQAAVLRLEPKGFPSSVQDRAEGFGLVWFGLLICLFVA